MARRSRPGICLCHSATRPSPRGGRQVLTGHGPVRIWRRWSERSLPRPRRLVSTTRRTTTRSARRTSATIAVRRFAAHGHLTAAPSSSRGRGRAVVCADRPGNGAGRPGAALSSCAPSDVQRLPNGNTLVTFSNNGLIEEIDKSWSVVQTFSTNSFGYHYCRKFCCEDACRSRLLAAFRCACREPRLWSVSGT
jgi:hypothetical protein